MIFFSSTSKLISVASWAAKAVLGEQLLLSRLSAFTQPRTEADMERLSAEFGDVFRFAKVGRLNARLFGENGTAMCDKCEELDKKIEHHRQLAERVHDPLLSEGVNKLIEKMEAQKAAFHPEQK